MEVNNKDYRGKISPGWREIEAIALAFFQLNQLQDKNRVGLLPSLCAFAPFLRVRKITVDFVTDSVLPGQASPGNLSLVQTLRPQPELRNQNLQLAFTGTATFTKHCAKSFVFPAPSLSHPTSTYTLASDLRSASKGHWSFRQEAMLPWQPSSGWLHPGLVGLFCWPVQDGQKRERYSVPPKKFIHEGGEKKVYF